MGDEKKKPCAGCGPGRAARAVAMRNDGSWTDEQSCLECVEKHIGAALVMHGEMQDGYKHRMKVVGHLFKAEHEGADYPKLHDMIRANRVAFQMSGATPDWNAIEDELIKEQKAEKAKKEGAE